MVVVQLLDDDSELAVQVCTGTLLVLFVEQVVVIQFGEVAVTAVQDWTGVGPVVFVVHVVCV